MRCLNVGCGSRFHPTWTNIDFTSSCPGILAHDLRRGIPFPDNTFDLVYHSHVLEHFERSRANGFMRECLRVLTPGGVVRVVVPDLERIAREYLAALERAETGVPCAEADHHWMMLEMYDQTVRNVSGGQMADFLSQSPVPNEEFVIMRCGVEARKLMRAAKGAIGRPLKWLGEPGSVRGLIQQGVKLRHFPRYLHSLLLKLILPEAYHALQIGRFRLGGEVHQWMYDHFSLSRLLIDCGFKDVVRRDAFISYIPEWTSFSLDTEPDGSVYKPDSLYMEARKP
jgi:predicted SAM-dependent methyltransferase